MGWSIGFDRNWQRDIGYGVPAQCDHPDCTAEIHRGLSYACGEEPYGGEFGCGLFFCGEHRLLTFDADDDVFLPECCERCTGGEDPFTPSPDLPVWILHKLTDESWSVWRSENPEWVREAQGRLKGA